MDFYTFEPRDRFADAQACIRGANIRFPHDSLAPVRAKCPQVWTKGG